MMLHIDGDKGESCQEVRSKKYHLSTRDKTWLQTDAYKIVEEDGFINRCTIAEDSCSK